MTSISTLWGENISNHFSLFRLDMHDEEADQTDNPTIEERAKMENFNFIVLTFTLPLFLSVVTQTAWSFRPFVGVGSIFDTDVINYDIG